MNDIPPIKKYLAECIGTLLLVVFGCGTAVAVGCDGTATFGSSYLLTALAFGLVVMALAYSIGPVSGCHVNPAVSLAMVVSRKMSLVDFFCYVIAQFAGAAVGALLLSLILGPQRGFAANHLYNSDVAASLGIECVLTFMFVLAVLGAASRSENGAASGLVIGLSLTLAHIFGIALTGTSVNPARSFGPALLTGGDAMSNLWVFIAGPFAGALLAAGVYAFLTHAAAGRTAAVPEPAQPAPIRRVAELTTAAAETPKAKPKRGARPKKAPKGKPAGEEPAPTPAPVQAQARTETPAPPPPQPTADKPAAQPPRYATPFSPFPFGPSDPYSPFSPYASRDPFAPGEKNTAKSPSEDKEDA